MIAAPLNDRACLAKLTTLASEGAQRHDVRDMAARFASTQSLARWIRSLPQRDDDGNPSDGPRVECDVSQRARLVAADPNCVERSLLYVAVAESIEPGRVRQLATIDTLLGRHTFPVEDGTPVLLDPALPRNVLSAGLWSIRNAAGNTRRNARRAVQPAELLAWLADLAEEMALETDGEDGAQRVLRARRAFDDVLQGKRISRHARDAALYALRMAEPAARMFGPDGVAGWKVARGAMAHLLTRLGPDARNARVNWERVGYWTGKAAATYAGAGSVYDPVYNAIVPRPSAAKPSRPTKPPAPKRKRRVVRVVIPRVVAEAIEDGAQIERIERTEPASPPPGVARTPVPQPNQLDDGVPASELE